MLYFFVFALILGGLFYNTFLGGGAKRELREKFYGYYYAEDGVTCRRDKPNSREAFESCAENRIGIKASVIMSADQKIFVANKYDLKEIRGEDRSAKACTGEELEKMGLLPAEELLKIAGNKVPVILELKIPEDYKAMCLRVARMILETKRSNIAVACTVPGIVAWFKQSEKGIMRAFIGAPSKDYKSLSKFEAFMTGNLVYNGTCRPQIILYRNKPESFLVKFANNIGGMSGVWTVTSPEEGKAMEDVKDIIVCRGFMPENPHFKILQTREKSLAEIKEEERLERKAQNREAREKLREEQRIEKEEKKTGVAYDPNAKKARYFYDEEEFGASDFEEDEDAQKEEEIFADSDIDIVKEILGDEDTDEDVPEAADEDIDN